MIFILFLIAFNSFVTQAKTVHYELNIRKSEVNLSGKKTVDWALTVNGGIPAPTLEFTEGDDAEIVVHNQLLDEETSVHWHGILLPPEMDGVAYVNTPPIHPGESFTFKFKIRQHGTYWYHSHTMLQEQKGVYGAFIIHPKNKKIKYDKDLVVVLSDWSDENADQIVQNLRKDGDYYLYKKNSIRSWFGALQEKSLGNLLHNEWIRMGGMDLSDVGYDAFLINGQQNSQILNAQPGEKIRVRIINSAASSYFYVSLGKLPMKVISADGIDIEPIETKELFMGMAETYDILLELPQKKNYELRATSQDITGFASGWIGSGEKISAENKVQPNLYATMDHSGMNHAEMDHSAMEHSKMDHSKMNHEMNDVIETLTVDQIQSQTKTDFSKKNPTYDLKLVLDGSMQRYIWHINGKAIYQDRNIEVKEGDVVRFTFVNNTMMHHPMHLHGHFFRVLNSANEFSPLKHTVDVPPHGTRTIEFLANEPGEWMFHCHNLYHMKTGMARFIKYKGYTPKAEIAKHQEHDPHLHDHLYYSSLVNLSSNHAQVDFHFLKTWDDVEVHFATKNYSSSDHIEFDLFHRHWLSNYLNFIFGGTYFAEFETNKPRAVVGFGYQLPLLIESNFILDHTGQSRIDLEKKFQWTQYIFSDLGFTFRQQRKTEFSISLMYADNWNWSAGINLTEDSSGIGFQYRF